MKHQVMFHDVTKSISCTSSFFIYQPILSPQIPPTKFVPNTLAKFLDEA